MNLTKKVCSKWVVTLYDVKFAVVDFPKISSRARETPHNLRHILSSNMMMRISQRTLLKMLNLVNYVFIPTYEFIQGALSPHAEF